jgi:hypothetical protein
MVSWYAGRAGPAAARAGASATVASRAGCSLWGGYPGFFCPGSWGPGDDRPRGGRGGGLGGLPRPGVGGLLRGLRGFTVVRWSCSSLSVSSRRPGVLDHGGVLVVEGGAGIGKTALLDAVGGRSRPGGRCCARGGPVLEAGLPSAWSASCSSGTWRAWTREMVPGCWPGRPLRPRAGPRESWGARAGRRAARGCRGGSWCLSRSRWVLVPGGMVPEPGGWGGLVRAG